MSCRKIGYTFSAAPCLQFPRPAQWLWSPPHDTGARSERPYGYIIVAVRLCVNSIPWEPTNLTYVFSMGYGKQKSQAEVLIFVICSALVTDIHLMSGRMM